MQKTGLGDALIVKAIIDLGHSMGMKFTTEGIESQAQWDMLVQLGSDTIKGYFISRPMPGEDFTAWWQAHTLKLNKQQAA